MDGTKRVVAIIKLEPKGALKWFSIHIEIELYAAVSHFRQELVRGNSEALRNVAACRAVLHCRVAEARHSLPETTNALVGFDEDNTVVELEQSEEAELNRASAGGFETDVTKNH